MKKQLDPEVIDDDNPEWTDEETRRAVRFDALPDSLQKKLRGRPKAAQTKERITIRLSPDVVSRFRATGNGWQTRIDSALRDWLRTDQVSGIRCQGSDRLAAASPPEKDR